MAKARRRRAKQRSSVNRTERVQATPETLAKLRPCPLKAMLHRRAVDPHDPAGLQPEQYEAALQIWDAHDALVKGLKAGTVDLNKVANAHGGTSDGKARLIAIYLQWADELPRRFYLTSSRVVGWIDDSTPHARMSNDSQRRVLTRACDFWIELMGNARKSRSQERVQLAA